MLTHSGEARAAPAHGQLDPRGATSLTRWLLDPVSEVSAEVHAALIADVDLSLNGLIASFSCFLLLNGVCCRLSHAALFRGFFLANLLLTVLRLCAWFMVTRQGRKTGLWRTDFYVLATLLWCLMAGGLGGASMLSPVAGLQVLGAALCVAPQGALASRNFPAPRFATAIILCLEIPFIIGAGGSPDHWLILLALFAPPYLLGTLSTIKRFQRISIENYVARFASRQEARRDPLTGILNRRGMADALEQGAGHITLFCMDLDGFKQINDRYGHAAGDLLLQMVTARLSEVARKHDSLARLGGDEFALIAPGLQPAAAEAVAARLVNAISHQPYELAEDMVVELGVSVGYACAPEDAASFRELSELADGALYAVKQRGKGSWQRACPGEGL